MGRVEPGVPLAGVVDEGRPAPPDGARTAAPPRPREGGEDVEVARVEHVGGRGGGESPRERPVGLPEQARPAPAWHRQRLGPDAVGERPGVARLAEPDDPDLSARAHERADLAERPR